MEAGSTVPMMPDMSSIPGVSSNIHDDFKELVLDLVGKVSLEVDIHRKISNLESLISLCATKVTGKIYTKAIETLNDEIGTIDIEIDYNCAPGTNQNIYVLNYKYYNTDKKAKVVTSEFQYVYDRIIHSLLFERASKLWVEFQSIVNELVIKEILPWELKEELFLSYPDGSTKTIDKERELEDKKLDSIREGTGRS